MIFKTAGSEYWLGDIVDGRNQGPLFVNSIDPNFAGGEYVRLTHEFHPKWTGSYMGIFPMRYGDHPMVERGNFYKHFNGLPVAFKNPCEEAEFWFCVDEAEAPELPKVASFHDVLKRIDKGVSDGYFVTKSTMMYTITSWHEIRLKDRKRGRQLAEWTLNYHRYQLIRRAFRKIFN